MKHILLVEDDESLRSLLRISLEKMGYTVTEARDGKEALKLYKDAPVDLVLTDIMMPEKEGLEIIRELRRGNPELKIIAMSGGGRTNARDTLKMAKLFGATAVFGKPFSFVELRTMVVKLLSPEDPDNSDPVFERE
jgi:DNA-binding response OmpR family regulator